MKLVELLARELSEWPDSTVCITQDSGGAIYGWAQTGAEYRNFAWYSPDGEDFGMHDIEIEDPDEASDNKKSVVTRAQWQAERDRQKGGEWKRHRGGKQPVADEVRVEFKFRSGVTGECFAGDLLWDHQKQDDDVMQYRIISQPQAEDGLELVQGAQDAVISCIAHNFEVGKITHGPIMMGDEIVGEASPEWNQQAKWDQIETPFKWRDEVTELNAYIEKYTRERDALIERLASEGFSLIPPVVGVVSEFSGVDMSDWRNWKAGDIVVCSENYNKQFTQGKKYELSGLDNDERYPGVQIKSDDMGEVNGWGAERFKFHSRP